MMAKGDKNSDNYFERRALSEQRSGQRTYNTQQSFIEALGGVREYEITDARETSPTYNVSTAPTLSPDNKRTPRCTKIAYSAGKEQLVVRFYDGTWWYYNGISVEMWNNLKTSSSTGGWLHENGLNSWGDMGKFDPSEMTRENRVMFNS
jgi:hypothetical protein